MTLQCTRYKDKKKYKYKYNYSIFIVILFTFCNSEDRARVWDPQSVSDEWTRQVQATL